MDITLRFEEKNQRSFVPEIPQIKNVLTIFMRRLAPSFLFLKHFSSKQAKRLLRKDRPVKLKEGISLEFSIYLI